MKSPPQPVNGFSKLSKEAKIEWLCSRFFADPEQAYQVLSGYWHLDSAVQKVHDEFIENTLTNFYMPYGLAPNFLINDRLYAVPMVIEESSVVAAASKSAAFWSQRGGFKAEVISTTKVGQVHFLWEGPAQWLRAELPALRQQILDETASFTANMRQRDGGIRSVELVDKTANEPYYFQLDFRFETADAMGANFINTLLEQSSKILTRWIESSNELSTEHKRIQILMCILSNYTPECLVRCEVSCPVDELNDVPELTPDDFASKFLRAVRIAHLEPYRAVTHNKGIMNGIDSVVLATGNDFRAVEACAHAFAAKDGQYRSLTNASVENGVFRFWIEIPLALGTVGGLTSLHPMVKFSHELLGNPGARDLMQITAAVGLAQNFSALKSLVSSGIQKGHMKMHLLNILNQLGASEAQKEKAKIYFSDKIISFVEVKAFLERLQGHGLPDPKLILLSNDHSSLES
ncbi:MAG: hydroxymethylglutaryl-CoA reductase [Sphingomonadales bacterium]|nr:hydroxymethylglutaryl-CoA reductase [Sphingomonadales bacterium]